MNPQNVYHNIKKIKMHVFNATNFEAICDELAALEPAFAAIIAQYGYPHFFTRPQSLKTFGSRKKMWVAVLRNDSSKSGFEGGEFVANQIGRAHV